VIKKISLCVLIFMVASFIYADTSPLSLKLSEEQASASFFGTVVMAIVIGLGVAAAGCGIAQGMVVKGAVESVARQPEMEKKIQLLMFIGLGFIETLILYILFISIILLFANPFLKYIIH